MPAHPDAACDVCGSEPVVVVAAVPGVAFSCAYCRKCLRANAHPYWVMVDHTAVIGGYDRGTEWWKKMIGGTLARLRKTRKEFGYEVTKVVKYQQERTAAWAEEVPGDGSE